MKNELEIKHQQILFKTTVFGWDSMEFTNYGIHIKDGKFDVHFIQRFYRKSSTAKMWQVEDIYHSSKMLDKAADVPEEVFINAKRFYQGYLIEQLG